MLRPKQKQIDNMLRQAFREGAEKIAPPPSDKLWIELQKRLEHHKIPELEEKAGYLLTKETTTERKYDTYTFWRKHRYLAGIAAACFLMIVVTASTVPSSGMKHFFTQILTLVQGDKVNMKISISSDEAAPADSMESEDQTSPRIFSLEATEEETGSGLSQNLGGKQTIKRDAGKDAPPQVESSGLPLSSGERNEFAEEIPETILYTDEETFVSSLESFKILSADEIWQIKAAPEGFSFSNARITKTESYLVNIFQEYEVDEKQSLTLVQDFFNGTVSDTSITTADGLTHPIQVGPYSGYLFRQNYGSHMVIWRQDNSRVTLSGQLGEEELFEVLNTLEK